MTNEQKYGLLVLVTRVINIAFFYEEEKRVTSQPRKRPSTMSDIARQVGVSRTTVSFVLNNHASSASIPPETKNRILEAAKQLAYRPNLAAKGLRTSQTHTVGFIADEITTTPYAVNIIKGAQDVAWTYGKLLLIVNTGSDASIKETAIEMMLERQVEGIIYAAMYHHEVALPQICLRDRLFCSIVFVLIALYLRLYLMRFREDGQQLKCC